VPGEGVRIEVDEDVVLETDDLERLAGSRQRVVVQRRDVVAVGVDDDRGRREGISYYK